MPVAVRMPRWGMIMEEGFLQAWLVNEGDVVEEGRGIADVESDKTIKALEAPASGVLVKKLAESGATIPVGSILGVIAIAGDTETLIREFIEKETGGARDVAVGNMAAVPADAGQTTEARLEYAHTSGTYATHGQREGRHISPAALRMAKSNNVDWTRIEGSGPGGRVQISDVEIAMKAPESPIPLSKFRQAIAARTALSIQAPQAALCRQIDLTEFLRYRAVSSQTDGSEGRRISLTACLIPFITKALLEQPELNCTLTPQGLLAHASVHIGVVAQGSGGIFVPVIRDAQEKSLEQLDVELKALVEKASRNSLSERDMGGGTFTFSNAGSFGIELFQPLLNPPEVAILGMGSIVKRPWVDGETVLPRDVAWFCLTTDHRAIDGGSAGKFLTRLDIILQKPTSVFEHVGA